eukprot:1929375-Pyramimonas_sp.AAC.1
MFGPSPLAFRCGWGACSFAPKRRNVFGEAVAQDRPRLNAAAYGALPAFVQGAPGAELYAPLFSQFEFVTDYQCDVDVWALGYEAPTLGWAKRCCPLWAQVHRVATGIG